MAKYILFGASLFILGNSAALAETAPAAEGLRTLSATAELKDFSGDRGDFRSFTLEGKFVEGDTTILIAPTIGERTTSALTDDAMGIRGSIYQDWSPTFSTRTALFLAEDTPIFAHIDIAQDVTIRVAERTTVTPGIRWAEYAGKRDVTFVSLGARRYFRGGSISYRLTGTQAEGQDFFFAHLVNLRLNDEKGEGNTQVWLGVGDASLSQFNNNITAETRELLLQRYQPLGPDLNLIAAAGLSSNDSVNGDYTIATFRIGLSLKLD